MNIYKLEQMLQDKYQEFADNWGAGNSKHPYQEWDECLDKHGAFDRHELLFIEDDEDAEFGGGPSQFLYFNSPARKGNLVKIPKDMAEKILVLGFA
jgi:hypothetical protein